jgi:hypothetical protein
MRQERTPTCHGQLNWAAELGVDPGTTLGPEGNNLERPKGRNICAAMCS